MAHAKRLAIRSARRSSWACSTWQSAPPALEEGSPGQAHTFGGWPDDWLASKGPPGRRDATTQYRTPSVLEGLLGAPPVVGNSHAIWQEDRRHPLGLSQVRSNYRSRCVVRSASISTTACARATRWAASRMPKTDAPDPSRWMSAMRSWPTWRQHLRPASSPASRSPSTRGMRPRADRARRAEIDLAPRTSRAIQRVQRAARRDGSRTHAERDDGPCARSSAKL